ncbi:ArnT family glycosyltransferase [Chloroflexus sp.]|uniref:ArnT family glycosyltransferase n=1 Tax=Chloroflexus sp. TaxID=1904827 RepID=UPI00298EDC6B|nr:glycosyltransferase family 39 protein [Chloroflexus sp.]MDW8404495.1 glycosyltransferase family 39 protein [Chloroflexus sp.]
MLWIGCIIAGAYWQLHVVSEQYVTIGSFTDGSYVQRFHEREQTLEGNIPFRWTQPNSSTLQFWPLPANTSSILRLDLYRPSHANLTVSLSDHTSYQIAIKPERRIYQILIENRQPIHLTVAPALKLPNETRLLGGMLFRASLHWLSPVTFTDIIATFGLAPFLPLALSGLGIAQMLVRKKGDPPFIAPLALGTILIGSVTYPAWKIELAWWIANLSFIITLSTIGWYVSQRWLVSIFRDDRATVALLLGIGAFTLLCTFTPYLSSDGIGYYAYARAIVYKGNLSMAETFMEFMGKIPYFHTDTGIVYNPWSIGPALFWLGPLALYRLLFSGNGHDQGAIATTTLISALFGFGTTIIAYYCARRWFSRAASVLGALAAFFGSTLWFYSMKQGGFAHALSAFACALGVLTTLRLIERQSIGRWIAFGVSLGLMAITYWATMILATGSAIVVIYMLWRARTSPQRLRSLFVGCTVAAISAILVFSPQMIVWYLIYGSPLVKPPATPSVTWQEFHLFELLFARFGLMFWSPAAIIGLAGLWLLPRRSPVLGSGLLLAAGLYILFNALLSDWHGSGSFGTRRLTSLGVWYALGLAAIVEVLASQRRLAIACIGIGITSGWMFALIVRDGLGYFPQGTSFAALEQMSATDLYLVRQTWPTLEVMSFFKNSFIWDVFTSPISITGPLFLFTIVIIVGVGWVFWHGFFSPRAMLDEHCA